MQRRNIDEIDRIFREEYLQGPGTIGSHAIISMWEDFASNRYEQDVVSDVTRKDISRVLLRLTAELVASGRTDKLRTSTGDWVEIANMS